MVCIGGNIMRLKKGVLPAGQCILHDFIIESLGIPPITNYLDAYTLQELEEARPKVDEYLGRMVMMISPRKFREQVIGCF